MRSDGWSTHAVRRGRKWACSAWRREGFEESFPVLTRSQALYQGAEEWDPVVINWIWRFRLGIRKNFSSEDTPAVQQAAQRNCAVSMLRCFQDLTGQSPEQPGAADPVVAGGTVPSHPNNLWFNHRAENYRALKALHCSAWPVCLLPEQLLKSRWFKITLTSHSCQWEAKGWTGLGRNPCHREAVPTGLLSQRCCPALSHTVPTLGKQQYLPGPRIWPMFGHHRDSYETIQWRQELEKQEQEMYLRQANWQALTNLHKDLILSKQNNFGSPPWFKETNVSFIVCIQIWIWLHGQISVFGFPMYISLK